MPEGGKTTYSHAGGIHGANYGSTRSSCREQLISLVEGLSVIANIEVESLPPPTLLEMGMLRQADPSRANIEQF